MRIINEPTAAALAYGLEKKQAGPQKIIVFDLGGGTFDVSVLHIDQGSINVISTNGDMHLGGQDIDELLVQHCTEEFKRSSGIDLSENHRAKARIRSACRDAKHELAYAFRASIYIDGLVGEEDLELEFTRI